MKQVFMISHQVKYPNSYDLRICSQYTELPNVFQIVPQKQIAKITVFKNSSIFKGSLKRKNINNQLTWNEDSQTALLESLNGKKPSIDIALQQYEGEVDSNLSLTCQIKSGIKLKMFNIKVKKINQGTPFAFMKNLFVGYNQMYQEQENMCNQKKAKIKEEVEQILALNRQIDEQTNTEISHMKSHFLNVINQCKQKLKKYMAKNIEEPIREEMEEQDDQFGKKRKYLKIDRQKMENYASDQSEEPKENNLFEQAFDF